MTDMKLKIQQSQRQSAEEAKECDIQVGDEVDLCGNTYFVTELTDEHIVGILIGEHGHFVMPSKQAYYLDLRQREVGWTKVG